MEMDRLKELKLAVPFRPFNLVLRDGRRFRVERAYEFAIAPDGSRLGLVVHPTGVVLIWPDNVLKVEVLEAATHHSSPREG